MKDRKLHPLLERQLRKVGYAHAEIGFDQNKFIELVNDAYYSFDSDHELQKRSMELSSQELAEANVEMRSLLECFPEVLAKFNLYGGEYDYKETISQYVAELKTSRQQNEEQARMLRRQTEELIQARDHAISADKLKSEFLANMSHEIRTPLHGTLSSLLLLEKSDLNEKQSEYLELAKRSARSLSSLVNDILDFSKIEAGKFDIEWIPFSLRVLLRECLGPILLKARESSLDIVVNCPISVPDRLIGDPGRIRQVLLNLLGNAVKFTKEGSVELDVSVVSTSSGAESLRFVVSDTGIGIPHDRISSIFDPFTQAEENTSRRFGGTGLGLAIASKLAQLMGGVLSVQSTVGRGTTFTIELPLLKESREQSSDITPEIVEFLRNCSVGCIELPGILAAFFERSMKSLGAGVNIVKKLSDYTHTESAASDFPQREVLVVDYATFKRYGGGDSKSELYTLAMELDAKVIVLTYLDNRAEEDMNTNADWYVFQALPCCDHTLVATLLKVFSLPADKFIVERTGAPEPVVQKSSRSLKVLVADDIEINRVVAQKLLEEMGHQVTLAENGKEVLGLLQLGQAGTHSSKSFDLLLLDVQMPELDGIETAKIIRTLEREDRSSPHLPIIALTAHAMKGDRERFLNAGIDEYLSKPLNLDLLQRYIDRLSVCETYCSLKGDSKPSLTPRRVLPQIEDAYVQLGGNLVPSSVCRLRLLIERFSGDVEIVREIVGIFLGEVPGLMEQLKEAVVSANYSKIRSVSHALKGSFSNVEAESCRILAAHMENQSAQRDLESIPGVYAQLVLEVGGLREVLGHMLQSQEKRCALTQ